MKLRALPRLSRTAALLAAAGLASGCSLTPRPTEELSRARISVAKALSTADAGAADSKRALDKLALAQRWVDARDYGPARWLAEQAEVDAELALARAARATLVRTPYPQVSILAEKSN